MVKLERSGKNQALSKKQKSIGSPDELDGRKGEGE